MSTRWCIDGFVVEADPWGGDVALSIEDNVIAHVPGNLLAIYVIPWRGRAVELRRTRNLDVAKSELWVDGLLCPPGEDRAGEVKDGARCAGHGKAASGACAMCGVAMCLRCAAPDGCRCRACFDEAADRAKTVSKRRRWLGAAFGIGMGLVMFALGLRYDGPLLGKAGAGVLVLTLMLVGTGIYRERKEADELVRVPLPIDRDALDEPKQVTGNDCAQCRERIAVASDAHWCRACQVAVHQNCRAEHDCAPASHGPDWWQMRAVAASPPGVHEL